MENTMIVMDSFASLYKHGYKYISELKSILLDVLLNKYWMNTLHSAGKMKNADCTTAQMYDLSDKLDPCKISFNRQPFIVDGAFYISWACTLRIRNREKH